MGELSASKKKQLQEVASGMLEIYRTLVRMQYLNPESIREGPHDISSLLPLYKSLDIDPAITYLYSILPYVDEAESGLEEFFQGGRFADFQVKEHVEEGRNPLYDDLENEEGMKGGMRPWMTPLSLLGNHQSVIIYDAKEHCIGIIDQECGGNMDHNIHVGERLVVVDSDGEESGSQNGEGGEKACDGGGEEGGEWEDEDEGDDEEDEGEDEEDEQLYDSMSSRPAGDVLRDIAKWFEEFVEVPGDSCVNPEEAGRLYRKHGWPGVNFDSEGFLVDKARIHAAEWAKDDSERLIREIEKYQGWLKEVDGPEMKRLRGNVEAATNDDEVWLAKWELWKAEDDSRRFLKQLQEAEEARDIAFPDGQYGNSEDLILGEMKRLQEELWAAQRALQELQQETKGTEKKYVQAKLQRAEKEITVCKKAYEAAKQDAEKICPGKSLSFGRGVREIGLDLDSRIADLTTCLEDSQGKVESMRNWLTAVPESAHMARQVAEDAIQGIEGYIEAYTGQLQGCISTLKNLDENGTQATIQRVGGG